MSRRTAASWCWLHLFYYIRKSFQLHFCFYFPECLKCININIRRFSFELLFSGEWWSYHCSWCTWVRGLPVIPRSKSLISLYTVKCGTQIFYCWYFYFVILFSDSQIWDFWEYKLTEGTSANASMDCSETSPSCYWFHLCMLRVSVYFVTLLFIFIFLLGSG